MFVLVLERAEMTKGGKFHHGQENETRKVLFSFFMYSSSYYLQYMVYEEGNIQKVWQHSGNKCWHCIDYVIVRWINMNKCMDVSVRTGAKYNTDQLLVY